MSKKKNIDRLFQEGFKDFEVQPPSMVWDTIEKELNQKKKGRVIPLWWTLSGLAAGLAILFTSFYLGIDNEVSHKEQPFVNSKTTTGNENDIQNSLKINENNSSEKQSPFKNKEDNNIQLATEDSRIDTDSLNKLNKKTNINTRANAYFNKSTLVTLGGDKSSDTDLIKKNKTQNTYTKNPGVNEKSNTTIAQKKNVIPAPQKANTAVVSTNNNTPINKNNVVVNNNKKDKTLNNHYKGSIIKGVIMDNAVAVIDSIKQKLPSLEDIAAQDKKEDSIKDNTFKGRWAASSQVGPVYSNSLSGNAINEELNDNNRSASVNLSYGIGLSYQISPRLTVRTGINQVRTSYTTQDINYRVNIDIASRNTVSLQNFNPNAVSSTLPSNNNPITNGSSQTGFADQELVSNQFQGIKGEISQQLGYIEVPLELQYSLINNKFKINILGGMSALFLTDNVVAIQNPRERLELGKDRNFNDFNQSANIGLGLGYDFTNQLGFFLEPTFKYQLNTLRNNVANFKPYTIGVQSGITYKF